MEADTRLAVVAAVRLERREVVAYRAGERAHGLYRGTVQLLMVRHALPLRSEPGQGSDPHLSDEGLEQAQRLPEALARFPLSRLVSSPQLRSVQTAEPVAKASGLTVEIDERLAEYDRDMAVYIPIEQIRAENPEEWARMANGQLPSGVDEQAFRHRITAAIDDVVAAADTRTRWRCSATAA